MTVSKKFFAAVSQDAALKDELDHAILAALGELLKANGLESEAAQVTESAVSKVAEAHGFTTEAMEAVSEDELEAVAGGICFCILGGGGDGDNKTCVCILGGGGNKGDDLNDTPTVCVFIGG